MKIGHLSFCFVFVFLMCQSLPANGQDMLKQWQKQHNKLNASFAFRAGEPMGLGIQLYRGVTTGCTKSKGLIDLTIAKEGTVFSLGPKYKTGSWRPGGTRFGISWFHEVNHRLFGQYFYYGIGVQGGSRKFYKLGEQLTENFAWGPQFTLHGELPLKIISVTPHSVYCKISLFAEMIYHHEVGENFSYFRPAGGVRFSFFY
jgi:hypothetical protein